MTVLSREQAKEGKYILGQSEVSHAIYAAINPDGSIMDIPEDDADKADYYIMLEKILKTGEIKKKYKGKYGLDYEQWPEPVKDEVNNLVEYLEKDIEGYPEEGMKHLEEESAESRKYID